jgi:S-(hydroxymethyl)glutathione dehydrogenase / alcohol dehydrogenase
LPTTTAALFTAVGSSFEIAEVELEEPHANDVLISVSACGICGTDLHIVRGEWTRPVPMILGHECAGIVEAVGDDVIDLTVGDRVVVSWASSCGTCSACRKTRPATCRELRTAIGQGTLIDGTTRLSRGGERVYRMTTVGGFAGHVVMPGSSVLSLPDDIPLEQAAILGCAALTGVGAAVNAAPLTEGMSALVVGAGGIGQFVVQGARIAGASQVVVVDPLEARRSLALSLGATHAVSPEELDDLVGDVFPEGFDCTFDAVGGAQTTELAIRHTGIAGSAVIVGLPAAGGRADLDLADLVVSEKAVVGTIYGSTSPAALLPDLFTWVRDGRLKLAPLLTGSFPLEEIDAAVAASLDGSSGRVLVTL